MDIAANEFRYKHFDRSQWQSWMGRVIDEDRSLTPFEREKLDLGLNYPDIFFYESTYGHVLYKTLRHSEGEGARRLAMDLSINVSRFGELERCWQAREQAARERAGIPWLQPTWPGPNTPPQIPTANPTYIRMPAPRVATPLRMLRPAPAAAMTILISALNMAPRVA